MIVRHWPMVVMKTASVVAVLFSSLIVEGMFAALPETRVIGWGSNVSGEATAVATPGNYFSTGTVAVAGEVLSNIVAVSAGVGHSLALRTDRTVCGWGANFFGEAIGSKTDYPYRTNGQVVANGAMLSDVVAIAAGCGFSLAVKNNGTVVAWGQGSEKERSHILVPGGLSNVVAIAAGCNYSLALKKDGTLVGWGVRQVPAGLSNIVAIAAGLDYHASSLALTRDGIVFEWRSGGLQNANIAATNVVAIAAGASHNLALRADGTVFGWGRNGQGEATGVPTSTGNYASSGLVTIAGQNLTNIVAIAAGNGFSLGLKKDGTVVSWGRMNNGLQPAVVPAALRDVTAIAAGADFCLAVTTNRSLYPGK
jgi:trimeric autotransporter adhesin